MNEFLTIFLHTSFAHHAPYIDGVFIFVARWLPWIFVCIFCVDIIGRSLSQPKILLRAFALLVWSNILIAALKIFFAKPRPFEVLDITPLFYYSDFGSFPSGHAFLFASFVAFSVYLKSPLRFVYLGALFCVMFARVVVGVHFVGDVLFGAFLGFSLVYILVLLWNKKSR